MDTKVEVAAETLILLGFRNVVLLASAAYNAIGLFLVGRRLLTNQVQLPTARVTRHIRMFLDISLSRQESIRVFLPPAAIKINSI